MATEPSLPQLIGCLKSADWAERFHAAFSLGRLGNEAKAAVPALPQLTKSDRGTYLMTLFGSVKTSVSRLSCNVMTRISWPRSVRYLLDTSTLPARPARSAPGCPPPNPRRRAFRERRRRPGRRG